MIDWPFAAKQKQSSNPIIHIQTKTEINWFLTTVNWFLEFLTTKTEMFA